MTDVRTNARGITAAMMLAVASAAARAQTITLPTIRAYGPGQEERMLFRLADTLSSVYQVEDTAADTRNTRIGERARAARLHINQVLLAPVTDAQLRDLVVATSVSDSLRALAGDQYEPDGEVPKLLLDAVRFVSQHVSEVCTLQIGGEKAAAEKSVGAKIRTTLYGLQATLNPARTRAELLACERHELRLKERRPAQLFSELAYKEESERRRPEIAARVDSLARVATQVVVLRKVASNWFFPVRDRLQAQAYWRQQGVAPLNVGSVAGSGAGGVAFTELASPLLKMFRTSVNAVLAAAKQDDKKGGAAPQANRAPTTLAVEGAAAPVDSASKTAIQRLLTGGGLFNVGFAVPVTHFDWSGGDAAITSLFVPRFGLTAPVLGATSRDSTSLNADVGLEVHAKLQDLVDGVGLIGQVRIANAWGSRQFASTVGETRHAYVPYATTAFGFLFGGQYLITASRGIAGPNAIRHADWQIGLTVVRAPTAP